MVVAATGVPRATLPMHKQDVESVNFPVYHLMQAGLTTLRLHFPKLSQGRSDCSGKLFNFIQILYEFDLRIKQVKFLHSFGSQNGTEVF